MAAPTTAEIRALSQVDFDQMGYPEGPPDDLQPVVDMAVAYIEGVTARDYDVDQPPGYDSLMLQAGKMRTEQIVMQSTADAVETAGDIDLIASFSAGSYSETRRDTMAPVVVRSSGTAKTKLNPWPALDELLWLLLMLAPGETNDAVSDRYLYWQTVLGGAVAPAWEVVEVDWKDNHIAGMGGWSGYGGGLSTGYSEPSTIYPPEDY